MNERIRSLAKQAKQSALDAMDNYRELVRQHFEVTE